MSSTRGSSIAALLLVATPALAQDVGDAAMAETLFKDAKELMAHGDYATACPKLAESNRLDPGTGTLTALALCHEAQGRTATAWAEFIEVQSAAQRAQRSDREELARQHIAKLEPVLAHLTIQVSNAAKISGLKVLRDDVVVGSAAWATAIAVDPGEHVIRAEAPNHKPFSARVTIAASDSKAITVDALEELPHAALPPSEASTTPERDGKTQRIVGLVLGGAGLVAIGIGSYFGVQAISDSSSARSLCTPQQCTDPSAVQLNEDAKHNALASDIVLGVGVAMTVVGLIVFLVSPHATAPPRAAMLRFAF